MLSLPEQELLLAELDKLETLRANKLAQTRFLPFVKAMWPNFIGGRHHERMADAFERVANGTCKRLIINMPPRHTKSEFASFLLPAWFLGRFPDKKVIQTSNTAELAVGFGRKVRNLVDTDDYKRLFPSLLLSTDSKAAGRWNTSKGGDYFAIGVGGTVTGKGADLFIIDDPHSEQEAAQAENSPEIYDKVYEWYTSGPRQRLQPGAAIVMVMCMAGDTPVLRPDGAETPLKDLRVGDVVATYEAGKISTARVANFRSSGVDSVYKIQMQSGITVRANARHPFLVDDAGELKWVRLKDLKPNLTVVACVRASGKALHASMKLANDLYTPGISADCTTTTNTEVANDTKKRAPIGVSTPEYPVASIVVLPKPIPMGCADRTLTGPFGSPVYTGEPRTKYATPTCTPVTESPWRNTGSYVLPKEASVLYAETLPQNKTPARIGAVSSASITTTPQVKSGGSCATTVTWPLGTVNTPTPSYEPLSTFVVSRDTILAILPDGQEEVFDVEIERTENFIANGLVSHNTRWSKRDLTGQVLKAATQRGGEEWEVIEFPAILPSGNPLWPEFWPVEELTALKEELPNSKWMAQYQQNPTSEASAIVKREWWQIWESEDPPKCEFVLMSWDTAFEKSQRADYSALTTWGVFYHPDGTGILQANIILLNAFRERMEFPRLKQVAIEQYRDWEPDGVIIEKKASGAPLIYEMRAMGIPVQEFTPTKGNDKISRLNAVSDLFASGRVWVPNTHWAEEVVEEVASFPGGEHDDYVDSVSMALMRFRKGGYITTNLDAPDEPTYFKSVRTKGYY
jgi:predicted phage terminase large subunit-like protein